LNAAENAGFWESYAEFAFEDLLFWLFLAALGLSCYPFLVGGVAAVARYFIRRKRWIFFNQTMKLYLSYSSVIVSFIFSISDPSWL